MNPFNTIEQTAEMLQVDTAEIAALVESGRLRAYRIGDSIRIRNTDITDFLEGCTVVPEKPDATQTQEPPAPAGSRWCSTIGGKARFRVSGSVAMEAEIWPGQMRYGIKLPKSVMDKLLAKYRGEEVRIGGNFATPGAGSIGQFLQRELEIKMHPGMSRGCFSTRAI